MFRLYFCGQLYHVLSGFRRHVFWWCQASHEKEPMGRGPSLTREEVGYCHVSVMFVPMACLLVMSMVNISWYLMISHIRNLVHVGMGWNILIIAKNDKQNVSFSGDEHPCSIYVGLNRRAQGVFTHSHVVCIHWGYYIVCINDIMTYFTSSLWFWVWKQRMPPSIAMW